jgi:hypothetical protein
MRGDARSFHDLVQQIHTNGTRFGRTRENVNGGAGIVPDPQVEQTGIEIATRCRRAFDMIERDEDRGLAGA